MIRSHGLRAAFAAITISLAATPGNQHDVRTATAPHYTISAVGPAGENYKPAAVNANDQIVGRDANGHPFYVDSGTIYHPSPPLDATCWALTGLNDSGQVAGYIKLGAGCTAPVEAITGWISGASLTVQALENTGGNVDIGCAAVSVNDAETIAGQCDEGTTSVEVAWSKGIGNGYGAAVPLTYPANVIAPTAMGSHPRSMTRDIDQYGDVIGQARCASKHRTSVAIIWSPTSNGILSTIGGAECHSPKTNTVPAFADGIASNVTGSPGAETGPVYVSGWCRVSGSGSSQKNRPCVWKLHYSAGKLQLSSPQTLDPAASRFARAVDVNASGWIVGDRGNRANTATLWVPQGSGHSKYSLTSLAASPAWVVAGPCAELGPASISAADDIVGGGMDGGKKTGFLMSPVTSHAVHTASTPNRRPSKRGVSGSGCQL